MNMNVSLYSNESNYSGRDEEHFQEFFDAYSTTSENYHLSTAEMLQYFHSVFRGDTLRFYNS